MKFVEQIINSGSKVLPPHLNDTLSQYEAFLKLPSNLLADNINGIIGSIYFIYKNLLQIPKINEWFDTQKNRRFLMHLIGHHYCIVFQSRKMHQYAVNFIMYKYLNFSCMPNLVRLPYENCEVYITIRPIEKGAQLQFAGTDFMKSKSQRQSSIWNEENILCACMRCTIDEEQLTSPMQRHQMISDLDFQYIVAHRSFGFQFDELQLPIMKVKCMSFLKKYKKITWCQEIAIVLETYIQSLIVPFVTYEVLG